MSYLTFSFWFTIIHTAAYILAGVIALRISKDIYESKDRHADFLRDMGDPAESKHVHITFIPAQLVRGVIMSLVLYPVYSVIFALPAAGFLF